MRLKASFYDLIESLMTKTAVKRVRAKREKCIRVDCDCPQVRGRRKLCKKHWNQFDYARKLAAARGVSVLAKFEREEVAAGRVGASRPGVRAGNDYTARVKAL